MKQKLRSEMRENIELHANMLKFEVENEKLQKYNNLLVLEMENMKAKT